MAFCAYREDKRREVKKILCKESLFRYMYKLLDEGMTINLISANCDYSMVEIWEDAKDFIKRISESKFPDIEFFDNWKNTKLLYKYFDGSPRGDLKHTMTAPSRLHSFDCMKLYYCFEKCVYAILFYSYYLKKDIKDTPIKECMDIIVKSDAIKYRDLNSQLKCDIDNDLITDDYDYWHKDSATIDCEMTNSPVELAAELASANKTIQKQTEEITQLKEQLADYEKGPLVIDPHNKVRLEVFCKLLENSGVDFNKSKVKAEAARLANNVTNIPFSTCKNYMTHRDLNTTEHKDEVLTTNTSLKAIGIEWQL